MKAYSAAAAPALPEGYEQGNCRHMGKHNGHIAQLEQSFEENSFIKIFDIYIHHYRGQGTVLKNPFTQGPLVIPVSIINRSRVKASILASFSPAHPGTRQKRRLLPMPKELPVHRTEKTLFLLRPTIVQKLEQSVQHPFPLVLTLSMRNNIGLLGDRTTAFTARSSSSRALVLSSYQGVDCKISCWVWSRDRPCIGLKLFQDSQLLIRGKKSAPKARSFTGPQRQGNHFTPLNEHIHSCG